MGVEPKALLAAGMTTSTLAVGGGPKSGSGETPSVATSRRAADHDQGRGHGAGGSGSSIPEGIRRATTQPAAMTVIRRFRRRSDGRQSLCSYLSRRVMERGSACR
nr:hypothetical protein [Rhodococcus sp. DK17]